MIGMKLNQNSKTKQMQLLAIVTITVLYSEKLFWQSFCTGHGRSQSRNIWTGQTGLMRCKFNPVSPAKEEMIE